MKHDEACPACGSVEFAGVEYRGTPEDWDGVSEWICQRCGCRWGRWTGRILKDGELEGRYGRKARAMRTRPYPEPQ